MIIGLLSCSKEKLSGAHSAAELYSSPFFQNNVNKLIETCDKVYVISGKFGLIELEFVMNNYDLYLGSLNHNDKLIWGNLVIKEFLNKNNITKEDKIVVVASNDYYDYVAYGAEYYNIESFIVHENYYDFAK